MDRRRIGFNTYRIIDLFFFAILMVGVVKLHSRYGGFKGGFGLSSTPYRLRLSLTAMRGVYALGGAFRCDPCPYWEDFVYVPANAAGLSRDRLFRDDTYILCWECLLAFL